MIPRTIPVYLFALAVLLTGIGIKAMSLLPSRYYFTFSQSVDAKNQSQFLARPELPSPASFCNSLKDQEIARKIEVPDHVIQACGKINDSILDVPIPINARVDGTPLHSVDYKENLKALLAELRAKATLLRDAINAQGRSYKKRVERLDDEALERILLADGTANLTSVALYAMDGAEDDSEDAYNIAESLRNDPGMSELLQEYQQLDENDRRELDKEGARSAEGAKYLVSYQTAEFATVKSFLMKQDKLLFWPALFLKLLPALVTGVIMAAIFREKSLDVAPLAAAFTAFLFCWPVIVLWDTVVSEEWEAYRASFYVLYIAYIITYFFAARLGAMLILASSIVKLPAYVMKEVEWNKVIATAAVTVISSFVTGAVNWAIAMVKL